MHGMINRAIQCFLRDTYGPQLWADVAEKTDLGFDNFEAMLNYPDGVTIKLLATAARHLSKSVDAMLEDIGTYLVSHPNVEAIRRLLRFGGDEYREFLFSLNEIEGRSRLALPDLEVPKLEIFENLDGTHTLTCLHSMPGFGYAMVGVMRAMADDYGALVFLEHQGWRDSGEEIINIQLLEESFAKGRSFDLSAQTV
jgi:hypothetical protein